MVLVKCSAEHMKEPFRNIMCSYYFFLVEILVLEWNRPGFKCQIYTLICIWPLSPVFLFIKKHDNSGLKQVYKCSVPNAGRFHPLPCFEVWQHAQPAQGKSRLKALSSSVCPLPLDSHLLWPTSSPEWPFSGALAFLIISFIIIQSPTPLKWQTIPPLLDQSWPPNVGDIAADHDKGLVQSVKEGQLLQVRSGWRVMGRKGQRGTEKDMLPSLLFSILISSLLIEPSPAPLNSSKGSHGTVERSGTFHRRRVFELCFWNCQSWSIYKGGWESSLPRVSVRSKWRLQRCASLCSSFLSSLWTHSFFTSSSLPRLSPLCLPSQDILITTHPGDADAYIFRCHELLKH